MSTYVIIPARKQSTRLPNKMLLRDTGKSLLQHTHEAAEAANPTGGVIVATDHPDIVREVRRFGGEAVLTNPNCASGTDRVAEVAHDLNDADVIVNLQGDEPEISPTAICRVAELLHQDPNAVMSTLASPIRNYQQLHDPACVKVVFDDNGRALYFSRSPIPHPRDEQIDQEGQPRHAFQHIGLYAYRRDFLIRLSATPCSSLEQVEKLEQLRVLQMGLPIVLDVIDHAAQGIDTAADYAAFVARQRRRAG